MTGPRRLPPSPTLSEGEAERRPARRGWYLLAAVAISVVWTAAALASMAYGTSYDWPDYVHVNYGLPLTFATHTLNTIAGPVDSWSLDLGALAADLAFWLGGLAALLLAAICLGYSSLLSRGRGA